MLRDKNLIPLSHQHQHALALCVRIDRASPIGEADLGAWRAEIAQLFETEIGTHFAAEEQILFPAARRFRELIPLVEDLGADHAVLRESFAQAHELSAANVTASAQLLATHVRKEERELFEGLQALMSAEELAELGQKLDVALKDATEACILPSGTTRLRPAKLTE